MLVQGLFWRSWLVAKFEHIDKACWMCWETGRSHCLISLGPRCWCWRKGSMQIESMRLGGGESYCFEWCCHVTVGFSCMSWRKKKCFFSWFLRLTTSSTAWKGMPRFSSVVTYSNIDNLFCLLTSFELCWFISMLVWVGCILQCFTLVTNILYGYTTKCVKRKKTVLQTCFNVWLTICHWSQGCIASVKHFIWTHLKIKKLVFNCNICIMPAHSGGKCFGISL